jgi:hypothetical protein
MDLWVFALVASLVLLLILAAVLIVRWWHSRWVYSYGRTSSSDNPLMHYLAETERQEAQDMQIHMFSNPLVEDETWATQGEGVIPATDSDELL